ncbi:MAG: hypothetical protein KA004_10865 [Verrucomicrobiales bacterium]|nr:hypothetical protein [Verrucomicrobiales bacterium]
MKSTWLLLLSLSVAAPLRSGNVSITSKDGQATVRWNGTEVWSGSASGKVRTLSKTTDQGELAAAFDGDKVLWENEQGAAAKLQAKDGSSKEPLPEPPASIDPEGKGISTVTTNGQTTVQMDGKTVWQGKTTGKVSARMVTENGVRYAAAFDGGRLLWENVKGAGAKVRLAKTPAK